MILVERLSADRDRAAVRGVWQALEGACRPSYWLRWPWVETWLDTLPAALRPPLVVARRGRDAVLCFFARVAPASWHRLLRWRRAHLQETGSPPHDLLYVEYNGWLQRPDADLGEVLDRLPLRWDELVMRRLSPEAAARVDALGGRYRVVEIGRDPSPRVDLAAVRAAGDEGYVSLLGRNTRAAIRRAQRGYEERGPLVLEPARDVGEALAFLDELASRSRQRFADREGGAFESSYFRAFHQRLVERRFSAGETQLLRLRAGERTIGLSYNLVADGMVAFYQSGLSYEDDKRLKPGLVLHALAVDRYARQGLAVYDFLAGQARYKQELATDAVELRSLRVQRRRAVFQVEDRLDALRAWVRARVPAARSPR